jgi:hypothetical protein
MDKIDVYQPSQFSKTKGGQVMAEMRKRNRFVKIAFIVAIFVIGTGMSTAHAGDLGTAAINAAYAGLYQAQSQEHSGKSLYYNSSTYLYNAYVYMDNARAYAYDARAYAYNAYISSGSTYAYYAYQYAGNAYSHFDDARTNAYNAYINRKASDIYLALIRGSYASWDIVVTLYYAAMGS